MFFIYIGPENLLQIFKYSSLIIPALLKGFDNRHSLMYICFGKHKNNTGFLIQAFISFLPKIIVSLVWAVLNIQPKPEHFMIAVFLELIFLMLVNFIKDFSKETDDQDTNHEIISINQNKLVCEKHKLKTQIWSTAVQVIFMAGVCADFKNIYYFSRKQLGLKTNSETRYVTAIMYISLLCFNILYLAVINFKKQTKNFMFCITAVSIIGSVIGRGLFLHLQVISLEKIHQFEFIIFILTLGIGANLRPSMERIFYEKNVRHKQKGFTFLKMFFICGNKIILLIVSMMFMFIDKTAFFTGMSIFLMMTSFLILCIFYKKEKIWFGK